MIQKIGHYSLENSSTIYDEEAMTALQLAGRTAGKVNECIEQVNKNTEALPGMVADDVQKHINNGAFDEQINEYSGDLEGHIEDVDKKHTTNLTNATATLNKRIDNIINNPGDGSTPTEVVDARQDGLGNTHGSLRTANQEQAKQLTNVQNGFVYLGGNACADIIRNDDGSLTVKSGGRWTYRGSFGTFQFNWADVGVNIADKMEIVYEVDGVAYNVNITIPAYNSLVLNLQDKLLYLRNHSVCGAYDMVLVQNGYANPVKGSILDEWRYRNIIANRAHDYTVNGAYLYGGSGWTMSFQADETTESLDVTMYGRPTMCYKGNKTMCLFTGDMIESVKESVTYPTGNEVVATFKIPGWSSLVFNHIDRRWHYRFAGNLQEGDILAISTGYCKPLNGSLLEEWVTDKVTDVEKVVLSDSMSTETPDGVLRFAELINNTRITEKFMWFTDPHLCEGSDWQAEFETYKKQLKACYDATPANFAICGGDWLGNRDTKAEACFKLGFIDGQMRSIFRDKYYPVVGNHDTNYQGVDVTGGDLYTGQLSRDTITNLWNTPGYYTFDGENTRFFVFDSELDWDLTLSTYKKQQLHWFCEKLRSNEAEHLAGALHIYYNWDGTTNHTGEMGKKITEIAYAFNNRDSITIDGITYDFSECSGYFHFVLAGHNHGDGVTTENDIPVILTTKTRQDNTPTFDLCLVDYDNGQLHLCRIGSGESRTVEI